MMEERAGVFVSLKKHGQLRGCIGTIAPTCPSIADEIIQNAISAGTKDPRFSPVRESELDDIVYSVDVLGEPEPVDDVSQLDVIRYGVIVSSGYKRGLLLPNLEGVDTVEQQVEIARQKAGIGRNEDYSLERFEVIRHE
jgi:AmmeMemoRadiSam system protein A